MGHFKVEDLISLRDPPSSMQRKLMQIDNTHLQNTTYLCHSDKQIKIEILCKGQGTKLKARG